MFGCGGGAPLPFRSVIVARVVVMPTLLVHRHRQLCLYNLDLRFQNDGFLRRFEHFRAFPSMPEQLLSTDGAV